MSTVFKQIIEGQLPAFKVAEDKDFLAFLDINPIMIGHTLVIPKQEADYLFDLEDDHLSKLIIFTKKVAKAIKKVIPCKRVGIAASGFEVAHTHFHLVPINSAADMASTKTPLIVSEKDLEYMANCIRKEYANLLI